MSKEGVKKTQEYRQPRKRVVLEERNGVVGKECTKCLRWLPLTDYSKHTNGLGDCRSICVDCVRLRKGYKKRTQIVLQEMNGISVNAKECLDCGTVRPLTDFQKATSGVGGVIARCKECCQYKKNSKRQLEIKYPDELSVVNKIKEYHKANVQLNYKNIVSIDGKLHAAAVRKFGAWKNAVSACDIEYNDITKKKTWDNLSVTDEVKEFYKTNRKLNASFVRTENFSLYHAGSKLFGSWGEAVNQSGFNYKDFRKKDLRRNPWTRELIIKEIKKLHENDIDLNTSNVRVNFSPLENAARRLFVSWENAVSVSGVDYKKERLDIGTSAYYGRRFEMLSDELLTEVGINFEKYNYRNNTSIKPDYIVRNELFLDAKLSEWTIYHCETIKKYEPHCRMLTVFFMRGNANKDEMLTEKTRIISVHKFIKQLPRHRQKYYLAEIESIENELNRIENGELNAIGNRSTEINEAGDGNRQVI